MKQNTEEVTYEYEDERQIQAKIDRARNIIKWCDRGMIGLASVAIIGGVIGGLQDLLTKSPIRLEQFTVTEISSVLFAVLLYYTSLKQHEIHIRKEDLTIIDKNKE